jgi:predicted aspartyl protease
LNQRVVSSSFPYLPISVTDGPNILVGFKAQALVDTGFDGGLILPADSIVATSPPDSYTTWVLGDGSEVEAPVYAAWAGIEGMGNSFPVEITLVGGEVLVGLSLLDHFAVTFDHGRQIIVEP